jgi:hypothetical protein
MPGMLRCLFLPLLVACLVATCKKDEEKKGEAPAPVETADVAEPKAALPTTVTELLAIKAASLTVEKGDSNPDGPDSLSIDDAGKVMAGDKAVATLGSDGNMTDMTGERLASIDAEGVLSISGSEETMIIGADGSITHEGLKKVIIGAEGVLELTDVEAKITYTGPQEAKRAMMIVLTLWLMPMQAGQSAKAGTR